MSRKIYVRRVHAERLRMETNDDAEYTKSDRRCKNLKKICSYATLGGAGRLLFVGRIVSFGSWRNRGPPFANSLVFDHFGRRHRGHLPGSA